MCSGHNGPADSGERLVVLTWTLQEVNSDGSAVEGKYDPGMTQDIASSLDAPCIVAQPFTGVTSTLSSDSTKLCGTGSVFVHFAVVLRQCHW